jgi:hypothetical protein
VTRRDRYLIAFLLVLAALASPIILGSHLSPVEKLLVISAGTALLIVRAGPWASR